MPAIIETRGLRRRFGDFVAVDGLDLAIEAGEIYGFLGPNGAGKSTTVRMLCTLLAPTEGQAMVAGHDVDRSPDEVRLRIGVALQEASLDPKQTGIELLRLQGRLYGLGPDDIRRRLAEVTELVDIGDAIDRMIGTYSGGMKRRLDLAAALIHEPAVLFLDEPTTGLDPLSRATVWEEVARLNRELGMTIFLTTQYLEEADVLADRVGIISRGRLAAQGTPVDLKQRVGSEVIAVQLSDDHQGAIGAVDAVAGLDGVDRVDRSGSELSVCVDGDAGRLVSPVAVELERAGVEVRSLEVRTPTLDDVFLQVTGERLDDDTEAAA